MADFASAQVFRAEPAVVVTFATVDADVAWVQLKLSLVQAGALRRAILLDATQVAETLASALREARGGD